MRCAEQLPSSLLSGEPEKLECSYFSFFVPQQIRFSNDFRNS